VNDDRQHQRDEPEVEILMGKGEQGTATKDGQCNAQAFLEHCIYKTPESYLFSDRCHDHDSSEPDKLV